MQTEKLLSRTDLDNNLTLELWDHSRPVAGDRWLVKVELRVVIPVTAGCIPKDLVGREAEIREALGPEVVFSQMQERNFIVDREVTAIRSDMSASLAALGRRYCSHRDFPGKFIAKRFADHQEKQGWYGF